MFEILLRTPRHEGADIAAVIDKLRAVEKLFSAVYSSRVRPGAARPTVPREISPYTQLKLLGANRSQSLGLQIAEPVAPPPEYDGGYAALPAQGFRAVRSAVAALKERNTDAMGSLFPEKADLVRVLDGFHALAPDVSQPSIVLRGLNGGSDIVLSQEDGEWAKSARPSLEPEPLALIGMVKAGTLGQNARFRIFDGTRSTLLLPAGDDLPVLRDLFGQVAKISGTATYTAKGQIQHVADITAIEPYTHSVRSVSTEAHNILFSRPLDLKVESSLESKGFALHNEEFSIHVYGHSLKEAVEDLGEEIEFLWSEYLSADQEEIHPSAHDLRNKLRELIKNVEAIE